MIRAIATAFPVASSATRSSAARLRANSSSLAGVRLYPPRTAHLAVLCDRDHAEVAVHVERDETHPYLLSLAEQPEVRRAKRQQRIRARGTPGQSQGRPTTNDGLAAHSVSGGLPNLASPRSPCPGTAADANSRAGRKDSMRRSSCSYNGHRPHRSLKLAPPDPQQPTLRAAGRPCRA